MNNNNNNNQYGTSLQEAPLSVSKEELRSGWLNLKLAAGKNFKNLKK